MAVKRRRYTLHRTAYRTKVSLIKKIIKDKILALCIVDGAVVDSAVISTLVESHFSQSLQCTRVIPVLLEKRPDQIFRL